MILINNVHLVPIVYHACNLEGIEATGTACTLVKTRFALL